MAKRFTATEKWEILDKVFVFKSKTDKILKKETENIKRLPVRGMSDLTLS